MNLSISNITAAQAQLYTEISGTAQQIQQSEKENHQITHKKTSTATSSTITANSDKLNLSPSDENTLTLLRQRDLEVRTHEAAHQAAAGQHSQGSPQFSFQFGPDGQPYAVGGHVSIDVSSAPNPTDTIAKMQTIASAAQAPANPSSQDFRVASQAMQIMTKARTQLNEELQESFVIENEDSNEMNTKKEPHSKLNAAYFPQKKEQTFYGLG